MENRSLSEIETAANAAPMRQTRERLMAIRALLIGRQPDNVAAIFFVDKKTLERWISRFNAKGIDGVIEKPRSGRPKKIKGERDAEIVNLMKQPEIAVKTHCTAKKFDGYLTEKMSVEAGYSTVVRRLHEKDFRLKVPRLQPVKRDEEARKARVEGVCAFLSDPAVELWYLDESGIEGEPRPRRSWATKGSKEKVPYEGRHIRANVCGASIRAREVLCAGVFAYGYGGFSGVSRQRKRRR